MSTPLKDTKHARLAAAKMTSELKLAEETKDGEEERAAFMMALVRCRKIFEFLQGQLSG